MPSPDTREPPRRSSHLTRPVDIARSGYFSHPRRASRDELASGASRLASTLSRHALLLVLRPMGAVGGPSRVGDSAGLPRHAPNTCTVLATPNRRPGLQHSWPAAAVGRRQHPSDRRPLRSSRAEPRLPDADSPRTTTTTLRPARATSRNRSNTAQSLRWPSGIVSTTERDDHPYPANGHHAHNRLALFVAKRHQRSRECGWRVVTYSSPNRLGLIKPRWKPSSRRGAIGLGEDRPDWRW